MAQVIEATEGKTRNLPISSTLKDLLLQAAIATGIDKVIVTSGGQCRKGTCARRTGSTRHDDGQAADLILRVGTKTLDFTDSADLPKIVQFVTEAARRGASGVGAGIDYMGPQTLHIGFGSRAVWGAGGQAANAPDWIRRAAAAGWAAASVSPFKSQSFDALGSETPELQALLDSDDPEQETDYAYADKE